VSKHKESKPAPLADWEVTLGNAEGAASAWHLIRDSRWKRTDPGWYTFTSEQGVVAEFPPGVVLSVLRKEPPVVVEPPDERAVAAVAARTELAAKQANGGR
jgi:hypothetical protein